jgi:hypothetical protein
MTQEAIIQAAVTAALAAIGAQDAPTPGKGKAIGSRKAASPKAPATCPYLSRWQASKVTLRKDGTFTHTNGKTYRTLTRDQAVAIVEQGIGMGFVYAVQS